MKAHIVTGQQVCEETGVWISMTCEDLEPSRNAEALKLHPTLVGGWFLALTPE